MNVIRLFIIHKDTEYAAAFGRSLAIRDSIFRITLASEENPNLSKAMRELNSYDMVLLDREWKEQAEHDASSGREKLIGLSETPVPEHEKGYIYKYGGLEKISSNLRLLYGELTGRGLYSLKGSGVKIIGFASGAGGVGTSCLAIATGRELTSPSRRDTLYLSFEETESTPVYFAPDGGQASISDYLYYLFIRGKENMITYTDSFLMCDNYGLCTFRPSKGINELPRLSEEQKRFFLDSLCGSGRFLYILIDFQGRVSADTEHLLKVCHKIFLVDDGRPLSFWKNQRFLELLPKEVFEDMQQKLCFVTNKWTGQEEEIPMERIVAERDDDSFLAADARIHISLHRGFGLGVKKIADQITEEL